MTKKKTAIKGTEFIRSIDFGPEPQVLKDLDVHCKAKGNSRSEAVRKFVRWGLRK